MQFVAENWLYFIRVFRADKPTVWRKNGPRLQAF
jgi:hypothetical protein